MISIRRRIDEDVVVSVVYGLYLAYWSRESNQTFRRRKFLGRRDLYTSPPQCLNGDVAMTRGTSGVLYVRSAATYCVTMISRSDTT